MTELKPEAQYSSEGPVCPYCETQFTADEGFYYDEDLTELECFYCDRKFDVRVCIETSWTTTPINHRLFLPETQSKGQWI